MHRILLLAATLFAATVPAAPPAYVSVGPETVEKYLGAPRFLGESPEKEPRVGVVNGLAYTAVGGEMLAVECAVMPGTGQVQLTGQLGDVMKESVQAAYTYADGTSPALVKLEWRVQKPFVLIVR